MGRVTSKNLKRIQDPGIRSIRKSLHPHRGRNLRDCLFEEQRTCQKVWLWREADTGGDEEPKL